MADAVVGSGCTAAAEARIGEGGGSGALGSAVVALEIAWGGLYLRVRRPR